MADDAPLSAYEKLRAQNIASNAAQLAKLGLQKLVEKRVAVPRPKRPSEPREPARASQRQRQLPAVMYTPGQDEALREEERKTDVDEGRRLADGSWLGERFGEADGVAVGTVFGAGDYQRLGRQEMMESGFFRPFVTPEWAVPGVGCFGVILNNDNGASSDQGDTILYAGSGGRRRGQNRTAPQSFDQDWTNVTNAALRLNCESGEPVRVVRGPKLQGGHGTADTGGGYRYDGLYLVTKAELVRLPGSRFKTAMFTLARAK